MAKVMGVGGVFFRCLDRDGLAAWYQKWLGMPVNEQFCGAEFKTANYPKGGYTVWGLFKSDTDYFAPSDQQFMVNLVVDDIKAALAQVAEGGGTVLDGPVDDPCGLFGWFLDPEGNKVELWQPYQHAE
ncbi:VOC family protein [Gallaecimonas sp. GXIMD4217]|uniref:VOC family protein n=1 Tax=Gallaecimonas sp. GXIMD4217 TaxID=3131927 RepID=UPI00311B1E57